MDLSVLMQYIDILVVGVCLCVGYLIKHSLDFIPNKYIPLIVAVLGLTIKLVTCISTGLTLEVIFSGLFSGLASTGMYEAFKNLIKRED